MSVKLYLAKIPENLDFGLIPLLSEYRQAKLNNATNEKFIKQSIAAELLLERAVEGIYSRPLPIVCGENGKPYFADGKLQFSISHSGDYVACALFEREIGLDIQIHRECDMKLAKRYFTSEEYEHLKLNPDSFTEIWTKKESYLKALGTGLSGGLSSFSVMGDLDEYYYQRKDDLHICVCIPGEKSIEVDMFEIKLL